MKSTLAAVVLAIFAWSGVSAQELDGTTNPAPWRMVAKSHFIFVGRLTVPLQQIHAALASGQGRHVDIEVGVTRALKGTAPSAPVLVRYYTEPRAYSPTSGLLDKLNGKDGILFLIRVDEEGCSSFFINDPNALQPSSPESLLAIESEVAAQDAILKDYRRPDIRDNAYRRVRNLVNNMTHPERAEDALSELQSLGKEYVPAMIHLMDDRRTLTIKQIAVSNPPGHWEGIAHYAPGCVVDAMSVLLSRITGETFGQIHNGGSEREEAAEVDAWRIYLYYLTIESETATQAPAG